MVEVLAERDGQAVGLVDAVVGAGGGVCSYRSKGVAEQDGVAVRDRLGLVFQAVNLLPTLTAEENIALGERIGGPRVNRQWMAHLVRVLGLGPGERLGHRPSEMSGGQQQRVAIPRALAHRPAVVFADEPTGNLDSHTGGEVLRFLTLAVEQLGQTW